jgi:hypothetical protein
MAQLEACRQLALAGSGRRPESGLVTAMQATFHRFAELGTPTSGRCRMREQRDGEATASAQVVQGGRVVADAELALTFPPSPVPVRRLAMAGNPREF